MVVSDRRAVSGAGCGRGVATVSRGAAVADWGEAVPGVASCDARALAFGSQASAASEANRRLRMWVESGTACGVAM